MIRAIPTRTILCIFLSLTVARSAAASMELRIESKRRSYLLGELVQLSVTATNASNEPVMTDVVLSPQAGFLELLVSEDGQEFQGYLGPDWGIRDVFLRPRAVKPGAVFEFQVDALWHHIVPGSDRYLTRALPFVAERCYWLKAKATLPGFERESNTIEVCMTSPRDRDLTVWNSIVAEPELARFIQQPLMAVRDEVRDRAQSLLRRYPSSTYAPALERALRERRKIELRKGRGN